MLEIYYFISFSLWKRCTCSQDKTEQVVCYHVGFCTNFLLAHTAMLLRTEYVMRCTTPLLLYKQMQPSGIENSNNSSQNSELNGTRWPAVTRKADRGYVEERLTSKLKMTVASSWCPPIDRCECAVREERR